MIEGLSRDTGNFLCQGDSLQLIATFEGLFAYRCHTLRDTELLEVLHIVEGSTLGSTSWSTSDMLRST